MKIYTYEICKYDFFNTAVADILRAIDGGSLIGGYILAFCCIDYMGMAIDPLKLKNSSVDFKKYVKDYLGQVNPKYKIIDGEIWAIRNSLIHTYGESDASKKINLNFHFGYNCPKNHLEIKKSSSQIEIWLDLPIFISELIGSIEFFFRSNKSNDIQLKEWYRKLIIIQGASGYLDRLLGITGGKIHHSNSHKIFQVLDKEPEPPITEIMNVVKIGIRKRLVEIFG